MDECIFCKIAAGVVKVKVIFENDELIAFNDVAPQAPIHILLVPKTHISSLNEVSELDWSKLSSVLKVIPEIAVSNKIDLSGYRVVVNTGQDGGQSVNHLHFHILGGRKLEWPPG